MRDLVEGHRVECSRDRRLELVPHRARAAVLLSDAVEHRVTLGGADLRLDRTFERANDVARGDLARIAREDVAAAGAALPVHEAGLPQTGDELLEVRLREALALRDGV